MAHPETRIRRLSPEVILPPIYRELQRVEGLAVEGRSGLEFLSSEGQLTAGITSRLNRGKEFIDQVHRDLRHIHVVSAKEASPIYNPFLPIKGFAAAYYPYLDQFVESLEQQAARARRTDDYLIIDAAVIAELVPVEVEMSGLADAVSAFFQKHVRHDIRTSEEEKRNAATEVLPSYLRLAQPYINLGYDAHYQLARLHRGPGQ